MKISLTKGRSLLFHPGHLLQKRLGVQVLQPLPAVRQAAAQADGRLQVLPLPLQGDEMAAHPVPHRVGAPLHLADLLQGHPQLPQQLDPPQGLHLRLSVIPVAVLAVPPGGEQPLRLVKADVLSGDAHQGLHLVDLQAYHLTSVGRIHLPPGGRSRAFQNFCPGGGKFAPDVVQ